ncbi:MAG: EthD family reductase [Bradyrhizobium sp.]
MIVFSVFYPATNGARFDADYYNAAHIPLVKAAFGSTGLTGVQVFQGLSSGDGGPAPYVAMAHLSFESADALQASLTGSRAAEVFSDIARFTDIQPLTQVSSPR